MECLDLALQAPTGSNSQGWQWVFVEDADKKKAIGDIYLAHARAYLSAPKREYPEGDTRGERMGKVVDSAMYLAEHMHEAPVLMIPCIEGREDKSPLGGVSFWASLFPAVWSFCLALRSRGTGLLLDDTAPARRRRAQGGRGARHSLRPVQPGRAVPDRLHQRHRLPAGQAAARRDPDALEHLVSQVFSGQTSTTPYAIAHGVWLTRSIAASRSSASITANPAIGNVDRRKGPRSIHTPAPSGLRT